MAAKMAQKFYASVFAASSREHPWRWAMAIAIGLAFGLMPKANLIAFGLGGMICFLRHYRLIAIVTAVIATISVGFTDPWMDRFGQYMLRVDALQPLWQEVFHWPIVPWLHWNNSIVMGSLVFSFASLPLTCAVNLLFVRRRVSRVNDNLAERKIAVRQEGLRKAVERDIPMLSSTKPEMVSVDRVDNGSFSEFSSDDDLSLESNSSRHRSVKKRERVAHRIDAHVDETLVKPNVSTSRGSIEEPLIVASLVEEESQALLQETVIEIVRYRPSETASRKSRVRGPVARRSSKQNSSRNDMSSASQSTLINKVEHQAATKESVVPSHIHRPKAEPAKDAVQTAVSSERPREEALRYLLWHLSGVKQSSSSLQERAS